MPAGTAIPAGGPSRGDPLTVLARGGDPPGPPLARGPGDTVVGPPALLGPGQHLNTPPRLPHPDGGPCHDRDSRVLGIRRAGAAGPRLWRRSPSWARYSGHVRTVAGNSCSSSHTRCRAAARMPRTGGARSGCAPSEAPSRQPRSRRPRPRGRFCRMCLAGRPEEQAVTAYARPMRQVGRVTEPSEAASATFSAAVAGLRSCQDQVRQIRPELCFEEVPAPRTLAPFATAIGAAVRVDGAEIATGRFVLLYDPAGQRGWAGPLRVIVYIRAELEPEIAEDPMVRDDVRRGGAGAAGRGGERAAPGEPAAEPMTDGAQARGGGPGATAGAARPDDRLYPDDARPAQPAADPAAPGTDPVPLLEPRD